MSEEEQFAIEYLKWCVDNLEHQNLVLAKLAISEARILIRKYELGDIDGNELYERVIKVLNDFSALLGSST